MINLLPPEIKSSYGYARRNVGLRKWVIIFLIAFMGVGAIGTYGLLTLQQSSLRYTKQASELQTKLNQEHVTQTEKQVQGIASNLKLTVQVLSKEVLFSKLITQIGAAMPPGAVLSGLTINSTTGALDLTANATNYTTATQVQVNMSDPDNKIFAKADIVNINCVAQAGSESKASSDYPCAVTLRALFGDNSPFLFINQGKKK